MGCDAGLVYSSAEHPAPFRYLTDYQPPLGDMWGVLTGDGAMSCVLTFHWGLDEARSRSGISEWLGKFDPVPHVARLLGKATPNTVGVIGFDRVPAAALARLESALDSVSFQDADELSLNLRRCKTSEELARLSEAASITERAIEASMQTIVPGTTEQEIVARLAYEIRRQGGDLAFPPMALTGGLNPVIFRPPTTDHLRDGMCVMIDVGAEYEGYQADIARTFVLGHPGVELRRAFDAVRTAHEAILESARPGVPCRALHVAGAEVLQRAGYDIRHRMGHGVGLATSFEWPSLDTEDAPLEEGMTLAIEPAVYVRELGSIKLEDMIHITSSGYSFLSRGPRALGRIEDGHVVYERGT
jgi:Xaa-Pro aminopeptidase